MMLVNLLPGDLERRPKRAYMRAWSAANRSRMREHGQKWRDTHREEHRTRTREWANANRWSIRANTLRSKFGATQTDIDAQIAKQNGCCAICLETLRGGRFQHIDHDHAKPGTFRGVLCSSCNTSLGSFHDDPELLERAAAYVRNGGAR